MTDHLFFWFVSMTTRARSTKSHEMNEITRTNLVSYFVWVRGSCACLPVFIMKRFAVTATLVLLILVVNVGVGLGQQSASLADRIQTIIDRPEFRHAFFGIEFYSLDTGKPLYKLNAEK